MFHCAYRDNVYLHDTHSFFRAGFLLFAWVSWRLGRGARKREKTNAGIEHFFCHAMDHLGGLHVRMMLPSLPMMFVVVLRGKGTSIGSTLLQASQAGNKIIASLTSLTLPSPCILNLQGKKSHYYL